MHVKTAMGWAILKPKCAPVTKIIVVPDHEVPMFPDATWSNAYQMFIRVVPDATPHKRYLGGVLPMGIEIDKRLIERQPFL